MVLNRGLTEGVFYSFWVYLAMLLPLLTDIPYLFVASRTAFASIDREIEIETTPGGTENIYTGTEKAGATESIEIRDASFRYSDNLPQVLDKVGIKLSKGEKAAVVGPVGGGKSTLIKLAAGLYPPSSGEFLFNSRDWSTTISTATAKESVTSRRRRHCFPRASGTMSGSGEIFRTMKF